MDRREEEGRHFSELSATLHGCLWMLNIDREQGVLLILNDT